MEVRATAKYLRVQPRKVRIVADELRGRPAVYSAALLQYHPSKGARFLRKVLVNAMANAKENHQINPEDLRIATIFVDEGPVLKRMKARAMGRGFRIEKKTSHITVVVEEDFENAGARKAKQKSMAKPRPTFGTPKKTAAGKKKKGAEAPVEEVLQPEEVGDATATAGIASAGTVSLTADMAKLGVERPISSLTPAAAGMVYGPGDLSEGVTPKPVAAVEETEATPVVEEATPVTESEAPEEEGGAAEEVATETTAEAEGAN